MNLHPPRYKTLFLDADNTLFDFNQAEHAALASTLEHLGIPASPALFSRYRAINDQLWSALERGEITREDIQRRRFNLLLGQREGKLDWDAVNEYYLDRLSENGHLLEGALSICQRLYPHCTLVITTNGIARAQKNRLAHSPLRPYIHRMIVSEETGYSKPQREFFRYCFDICGINDPSEVLMVGDSLTADIKGAMDFGIDACWYNPQGLDDSGMNPDYQIRLLSQLENIVFPRTSPPGQTL